MKLLRVITNFFKRTINMEIYLVTIDTTFANKLGKSLQNYGFCLASDANMARERFIHPLRQKVPSHVLADIYPYVYAYKLSDITANLDETNPAWSYVSTTTKRELGQQIRAPFTLANKPEATEQVPPTIVETPKEVTPTPEPVAEFKPPEGVTDPVQIAMLKAMFDMAQEIKTLKSAKPAATAGKVSVGDLEARFRAPAAVGDKALDPSRVPIPQVSGLTEFPKGKIDRETLARLQANVSKSRFEDMDDGFGGNSGVN